MSAGAVWIYGGTATQLKVTANGTALRSIPGVFRNNTRDLFGRSRGEDKEVRKEIIRLDIEVGTGQIPSCLETIIRTFVLILSQMENH